MAVICREEQRVVGHSHSTALHCSLVPEPGVGHMPCLPAPCLLQCWAFSACVSLITAVTSFMQRCHDLPTDWEVHDVLQQPAGPNSAAAQAVLRQLAAAGREGSAGDRCGRQTGRTGSKHTRNTLAAAFSLRVCASCTLPGAALRWEAVCMH